jgi:hypothetical protein
MAKHNETPLTQEEIIARLEKPKSMRYIRRLLKPIFEESRMKFGIAIVDIVEREHWGPNFDAYYDIWVRGKSSEVEEFFDDKLLELQLEKFVAVLAQIKKTDDYSDNSRKRLRSTTNSKKPSRRAKLAGLRP